MVDTPRTDPTHPGHVLATSPEFRTTLALDRTTLSWIRTASTFASFGFAMIGFFRSLDQSTHSERSVRLHQGAVQMGVVLVVIGLVTTALAALSHWRVLGQLRRGETRPLARLPLSVSLAWLIALLGAFGLWCALAA